MQFREVPEFWQRDAGLVCLGFRALGSDARFVALGTPAVREDLPLVLATSEQIKDPAWWRQWRLEGVVQWGSPRQEALARAIKSSGLKLVFHLDTDGLCSPHVDFWRYLVQGYNEFRDAEDAKRLLPLVAAVMRAVLFRLFPALCDAQALHSCAQADLLAINSPLALQRFRRLLVKYGRNDLVDRLKLIPGPVTPDAFWEPTIPKKSQIVAAARWKTYQKDAPKLVQVLGRVLALEPDYTAMLFGSGSEYLEQLCKVLPAGIRSRIHIPGYVTRAALLRAYQESRILLLTSHYESLHNPSVEALCCGCSVVGPAQIAPTNFLASASSGTLATSRSSVDLADAVCAEIAAWRSRKRDPQSISRYWRDWFLPPRFAEAVLNYFDAFKPVRPAETVRTT